MELLIIAMIVFILIGIIGGALNISQNLTGGRKKIWNFKIK
jgi:hypothetical protein